MKKTLLFFTLFASMFAFSQVGIGTTNPNGSAILDLKSTNKALLLTRVANTAAIPSPINGMLIYDLSSNCFKAYENGAWSNCLGKPTGRIITLDCAGATQIGTLAPNTIASNVSVEVDYTGGNGLAHTGQTVSSTGVTGLTATLLQALWLQEMAA